MPISFIASDTLSRLEDGDDRLSMAGSNEASIDEMPMDEFDDAREVEPLLPVVSDEELSRWFG